MVTEIGEVDEERNLSQGVRERCSICLEPICGEAYLDQCFHKFCFHCILQWTEMVASRPSSIIRRSQSLECPLCKTSYVSIIHDLVGNKFQRHFIYSSQGARLISSEAHSRRQAVYTGKETGTCKHELLNGPPRPNFWLSCWVQRELQALMQEDDVDMVTHHVVGIVQSCFKRSENKTRYLGKPNLEIKDSDWHGAISSAVKPFIFELADKFTEELEKFLTSGLDIASYDQLTQGAPSLSGVPNPVGKEGKQDSLRLTGPYLYDLYDEDVEECGTLVLASEQLTTNIKSSQSEDTFPEMKHNNCSKGGNEQDHVRKRIGHSSRAIGAESDDDVRHGSSRHRRSVSKKRKYLSSSSSPRSPKYKHKHKHKLKKDSSSRSHRQKKKISSKSKKLKHIHKAKHRTPCKIKFRAVSSSSESSSSDDSSDSELDTTRHGGARKSPRYHIKSRPGKHDVTKSAKNMTESTFKDSRKRKIRVRAVSNSSETSSSDDSSDSELDTTGHGRSRKSPKKYIKSIPGKLDVTKFAEKLRESAVADGGKQKRSARGDEKTKRKGSLDSPKRYRRYLDSRSSSKAKEFTSPAYLSHVISQEPPVGQICYKGTNVNISDDGPSTSQSPSLGEEKNRNVSSSPLEITRALLPLGSTKMRVASASVDMSEEAQMTDDIEKDAAELEVKLRQQALANLRKHLNSEKEGVQSTVPIIRIASNDGKTLKDSFEPEGLSPLVACNNFTGIALDCHTTDAEDGAVEAEVSALPVTDRARSEEPTEGADLNTKLENDASLLGPTQLSFSSQISCSESVQGTSHLNSRLVQVPSNVCQEGDLAPPGTAESKLENSCGDCNTSGLQEQKNSQGMVLESTGDSLHLDPDDPNTTGTSMPAHDPFIRGTPEFDGPLKNTALVDVESTSPDGRAVKPDKSVSQIDYEGPVTDSATQKFQQKSMSVIRGGEAVQVSYKVYIPQRSPSASSRRRLQR